MQRREAASDNSRLEELMKSETNARTGNQGGGGSSRSDLHFFFSSRRRHTRVDCDWSSDVCSSDLAVLRTILSSREFFSRAAYRAKIKSPFELVASALRGLGAAADTSPRTAQLVAQLEIGRASCRERV